MPGTRGGGRGHRRSWVLKGPDAVLSDATFAQVGTHGIGPDLELLRRERDQRNEAGAGQLHGLRGHAAAWLLLKATSTGGAGVFANVTDVQRLNTAGGVASGDCGASTVGTETSAAY